MQLIKQQTIGLIGDANSCVSQFCDSYTNYYKIEPIPMYEKLKSFPSIKTIVNKTDLIQHYQIDYEKLKTDEIMDFLTGYGEKLVLFIDIATFNLQLHDSMLPQMGQLTYNSQVLLLQLIQYREVKELVIVFNKELSVNTKEYFEKQIKSIMAPIQNLMGLKETKFKLVNPFDPTQLSDQFTKTELDLDEVLRKELFFYVLAKNKDEALIKILDGVLSKDQKFYYSNKDPFKAIQTTKIIINGQEAQYALPGDIAIISCSATKGYVGRGINLRRGPNQNDLQSNLICHGAILKDQKQQVFQKKNNRIYIGYMQKESMPSLTYKLKLADCIIQFNQGIQQGQDPKSPDELKALELYKFNFGIHVTFDWFDPNNELNKFVMMDMKDQPVFIGIIKNVVDIQYVVQPEMRCFSIFKNDDELIQKFEQGEKPLARKFLVNCHICQMQRINTVLLPCYHYRYCQDCAEEQKTCLFCDQEITSKIQLQYVIQQDNKMADLNKIEKYIQSRTLQEGKRVNLNCQQCDQVPFQTVKQCKQEIHYLCQKCYNNNNCKDCVKDKYNAIIYDFEH